MAYSEQELQIINILRTTLAVITLIACSFLICAVLLFQKYRLLTTRLVLWLSISSAFQCISYVLPLAEASSELCDFQAFWLSFCDWAMALWICIIAFNLFLTVVREKTNTTIYEKYYHIFVWGISSIFALLPFFPGTHIYGPAGAWCWIVPEQTAWRAFTWYLPLLIMFIYVFIMYLWILYTLFSQKKSVFYQREGEEEIRNKWKASMKLSRYPLIFIILWIFPIINRIENWITGEENIFWLTCMHVVSTSITGTINSIVYCYDERILSHCSIEGIKAGLLILVNKEERAKMELRPYELQSTDKEDLELTTKSEENSGSEILSNFKNNDGLVSVSLE